eukprot:143604_1
MSSYDLFVSIAYFTTYGLVFLVASVYSVYELLSQDKQSSSLTTAKLIKKWAKLIWIKKSVYISIIPHLFDQATDIGVIWHYYAWTLVPGAQESKNVNFQALFISSLAVIVMHKIISCSVIYALSESFLNVTLQMFDLMMVKAVYLNYKLGTNEPGNSQRLLQLLEATFESGPQLFISMMYIIKTHEQDPLILISAISSLWTLTARVKTDDKGNVKEEWQEHEFTWFKSCPLVNWRFMFRVIGRFFEITNRILILSLIWTAVGGLALGIVLFVELSVDLILCVWSRDVMLLANMLYHTNPNYDSEIPIYRLDWYDAFLVYRMVSPILYSTHGSFDLKKVKSSNCKNDM